MIEYRNVSKNYGDRQVVKNLSFTIEDGQFAVLIGPSGCGKTTTLKMLNRLIQSDGGEILLDGKNVNEINAEQLRQHIGYVIQQIGLFPNMTVEQNITVVPRLLKWDKARCAKRVRELLALVDMDYDTYAKKYPNELSGGQQQRVGVLRALAAEPPVILMDEPFGALDPITRDSLQDEVKSLQKRLKKTIIFVTHDMNEAIKMADVILFMSDGELLQKASPEEMLRAPANDIVREFMGKHVAQGVSGQDNIPCKEIMRRNVAKVSSSWRTLECVQIMSSREIDSLVVVDENDRYLGVVTIDGIKAHGKPGMPVTELLETTVPTVYTDTLATEAFSTLDSTKSRYLVVLDKKERPVGIITRTSMSKALAYMVWGGDAV